MNYWIDKTDYLGKCLCHAQCIGPCFFHLSLCSGFSLSVNYCLCLSICHFLCLSVCLPLSFSFCLCVCHFHICLCLPLLSVCLCLVVTFSPVCLSVNLSVSVCLSICLHYIISLSVCLSLLCLKYKFFWSIFMFMVGSLLFSLFLLYLLLKYDNMFKVTHR